MHLIDLVHQRHQAIGCFEITIFEQPWLRHVPFAQIHQQHACLFVPMLGTIDPRQAPCGVPSQFSRVIGRREAFLP